VNRLKNEKIGELEGKVKMLEEKLKEKSRRKKS